MTDGKWRLSYMPPHDSVKRAVDIWKTCEDEGLDVVGAADSQNLMREMYVCLTAVALATSRVKIMTYCTNPVTRHPTVTAGAFVALQELAPGRLMMGIGTGDSALWSMGRKPAKIQQMRDYILAVKALTRGETVTWDGHTFKPAWADFEPFDLPIYVMCSGPKILRMAAEVADGAVVHMGFAPEDIAYARGIIDDGRRAAGKDPKGFDVWWNAYMVFDESYDAAAKRSFGWQTSWLTMGSLEGKGIPDKYKDKVVQLNADTHSLASVYRSRNREEVLIERAKELGIYDWLMSRSPRLLGTSDDIVNRLNELGSGFDLKQWILFILVGSERIGAGDEKRKELIRKLGREVRPRLI